MPILKKLLKLVSTLKEQETIKLIDENAKWIRDQRDEKSYSLNYEKYRKQEDALADITKKFEAISDHQNNLKFKALAHEAQKFETDTTLAEKRERWFENLTHDVYIEEAITVLSQLKTKKDANYTLKETKLKLKYCYLRTLKHI